MSGSRRRVERLLARAGVAVGGEHPWDLRVHREELFDRILAQGSLGLGEAYMDGWWDCPRLDQLFTRVLGADLAGAVRSWRQIPGHLKARVLNLQTRRRAFRIGRHHYDIGNDLYRRMLDRRMIYSCAYWRGLDDGDGSGEPAGAPEPPDSPDRPDPLDRAQEAKLDLVCRKLGLEPGMRVLDVGCGWGGTLRFAAERYGVEGVGLTVSRRQAQLGRELCTDLPIEIRLQDYREFESRSGERFDRILSLGMFEHVGVKNYRTFMEVARRLLPDDGLFLLHTIGGNRSVRRTEPWIDRYIFPDSMLPSPVQVTRAIEGLFVLEDWHNFGADYDRTLMAWHRRFEAAWPELAERYDERFRRMWRYYLLSCAGSFRARRNQLWQIVLAPRGVPGGYLRAG
jgi:cyclopropane-fatty-acyl-phospholipid synthase